MPESQRIEWKASWHDDYLKWICGFANAEGGTLVLGKDDEGNIIGLADAEKLLEDLPNKIRDKLGLMPRVDLHEKDGKPFLEIRVAPSTVPISLRGAYYWRSGSVKQELKGAALNDFLLKKMGMTWDRVIEANATIDDMDPKAIERFKTDATKAGRLPDLSDLSDVDILKKLRLTTREGITRAALVLFGKDPGEFYPNLFVKIGRFGDSETELRFQEVVEGNLMQVLPETIEQLERKFLTKPVRFEGIQRIEELEYPVEALREMLLNALVHRNYLGSMTQMKVYDNRLTLWNAGTLPEELSIEQLFQPHESIPRNPLIAEVCYKAGYIDSWGRGVEKISEACKASGLAAPVISERSGGILVELLRPQSKKVGEKVGERVGEKVGEKLNENQQRIVAMLRENSTMSAAKLAKELGISVRKTEENLRKLRESGVLKRRGPARGGHWEVNDG
ncbi:MAG: putative DNA binding domain-containing protein [Verrucomicrobia bacterium]|nr:putative DNA binding domain-containing protein [Verrucomicrobiota bacterium]MDA1069367.1 putative DNA binding domain-containing protein [Verrucomicrobiota bacterium]